MLPLVTIKNHVFYDQEIPIPVGLKGVKNPLYGWDLTPLGVPGAPPLRFFQDYRFTASGLRKDHNVHTNLAGTGGSLPSGQMFDLKGIRVVEAIDGVKFKGRVKVVFKVGCGEGGPMFDLEIEPGKVHDLGKTIRLAGLECFMVEVSGVTVPTRVELHGDLHRWGHSNRISPDGQQLYMLWRSDVRTFLELVERAIPETKDPEKRRSLSYLHRSLRSEAFDYTGGFHVAQLLNGDVSVANFETAEARDAYCKAFGAIGDVELPTGFKLKAQCWRLPEEIETIADEGVRERAMEAWKQVLAPFQDQS